MSASPQLDRYFWNQGPNSNDIWEKEDYLKEINRWKDVRDTYSKKEKHVS